MVLSVWAIILVNLLYVFVCSLFIPILTLIFYIVGDGGSHEL